MGHTRRLGKGAGIGLCGLLARVWLAGQLAISLACGDDDGGGDDDGVGVDAGTPDAGPPVIDREQSGGAPRAIELAGDLAYIALGPRLSIWRVPAEAGQEPELVGETAPLRGVIEGLTISGDRAYVAERLDLDGVVHIIDISDPARPVEVGSFAVMEGVATMPRGMVVVDDRLFIADHEQGIAVMDLADPDAPSLVQLIPIVGGIDLELVDTRLYYILESGFGGLFVGALDLDNDLLDMGGTNLIGANGAAVGSQHLVVSAGVSGIAVQDMTDPMMPVERFTFTDPKMGEGPFARAVAVSGTTAWIPAQDGLHILDLETPEAITRSGPLPLATQGANAAAVRADDTLVEITDRGRFLTFDVSDPAEPSLRASADVTLCADCVGVAVSDDLVFAADFVGGLRAGQVAGLSLTGSSSEPAEMVVFEDVAIAGDVAYLADWAFGLRIYDVSNPSAPALVGSVDTAGYPSSVAVQENRAYLGESTNGGFLRVIDITDPANAEEIGFVETSQARDVEVRGDLAYVADGSLNLAGGLRIFDVSDPAAIELVGYYAGDEEVGCLEAIGVALAGEDLAVVACSSDDFHIVDISQPARPTRRSLVVAPEPTSAWSVAAWEGGAALGHDFGVIVVDLADPDEPVTTATHDTSWFAGAFAVPGDGRLVASCGLGGVYQWLLP
jgi:hypothetical protein